MSHIIMQKKQRDTYWLLSINLFTIILLNNMMMYKYYID